MHIDENVIANARLATIRVADRERERRAQPLTVGALEDAIEGLGDRLISALAPADGASYYADVARIREALLRFLSAA
jgi:hypothetical protein